jgi:putative transposase
MKFAFVAKHRGIWPVRWMCEALGVSRSGFHAWLTRSASRRARADEEIGARVRASFLASDRTYGARRVWRHSTLGYLSPCGVRKKGGFSLGSCPLNRQQARGLSIDAPRGEAAL